MTIDRRVIRDVGFALLIALPSVLPAAPSPWNADDEVGRAESRAADVPADESEWAQSLAEATTRS